MKKNIAIISDIDGTIADRSHRLHHLENKKDWDSFFSEMEFDPPIDSVIEKIMKYVNQGNFLILVTGRPEKYRETTKDWIRNNTPLDNYLLLMRPKDDYRLDVEVKSEMLASILNDYDVIHVFEDRIDLLSLWENNGLDVTLVSDSNN